MKAGDFATACPKLSDSQRLDPALGTLLNLALCYEKNGQIARAWLAYREAGTVAHVSGDERETLAIDAAALLAPLVPKLTVRVDPQDTEIVVLCDAQRLPPSAYGMAVPIDPGERAITASAPKRKTRVYRVTLAAGQNLSISIPRLDLAEGPSDTAKHDGVSAAGLGREKRSLAEIATRQNAQRTYLAELNESIRVQRTIGWSLEALGIVGIAAGTALALYGKHTYDKGNCDANGLCASEVDYDFRRSGLRQTQLATVGFSIGITAAVIGTLLLWTSPHEIPDRGLLPAIAVHPTATVSKNGWALSVRTKW